MIGNILDNTTELDMIKYTFSEIFSSGGATLYKNPSDQTVNHQFPIGTLANPETHISESIRSITTYGVMQETNLKGTSLPEAHY